MEIVSQQGDIMQVKADAYVDPSARVETPVGEAAYEDAKPPFRYIIHAPVVDASAQTTTVEKVRQATLAGLMCADSYGVKVLAIPGIGVGVGGLSPTSAAEIIVETLRHYETASVRKVILVDHNPSMAKAFHDALLAERA